jgi:hypothetical protein
LQRDYLRRYIQSQSSNGRKPVFAKNRLSSPLAIVGYDALMARRIRIGARLRTGVERCDGSNLGGGEAEVEDVQILRQPRRIR